MRMLSLSSFSAKNLSIKSRIILIIVIPSFIYCLASAYSIFKHTESIKHTTNDTLRLIVENTLSEIAIQALRRGNNLDLLDTMKSLIKNTDIGMITVYGSTNEVFATLGEQTENSALFSKELFFRQKIFTFNELSDETIRGNLKYLGKISFSINKESFASVFLPALLNDFIVLLLTFIACTPLLTFLYRSITYQLSQLKQDIDHFKKGEYHWLQQGIQGTDELGQVRSALHDAALTIKQQTTALENQVKVTTVAREAADRANNQKDVFLAGLGYGLERPVSGITSCNEILRQHLSDAEDLTFELLDEDEVKAKDKLLKLSRLTRQANKALYLAHASCTEVNSLLNGFIQAKQNNYQIDITPSVFNLEQQLNRYLSEFHDIAMHKGLGFRFSIVSEFKQTIKVYSDWTRIQQVLNNLISNAIKFTTVGEIIIKIYVESHSEDSIFTRIQVTDTGCGIATKEHIHTLFEGHKPYGLAYIGQGLSIARNIATKINGKIDLVYSHVNQGSCFSFSAELPIASNQANTLHYLSHVNGPNIVYADQSYMGKALFQNACLTFDVNTSYVDSLDSDVEPMLSTPFDIIVISDSLINEHTSRSIEKIKQLFFEKHRTRPIFIAACEEAKIINIKQYLTDIFDDIILKPCSQESLSKIILPVTQ